MKFIPFILSLLISFSPSLIKAQDSHAGDVALYHYMIHLSEEFQSELMTLDDFVDDVKDAAEGKPFFLDYILEPYYLDLQESLEKDTDLSLLPYESFTYQNPNHRMTRKKAIRAVKSDYYARMDMFIRPAAFSSSTTQTNLGVWQKEKKKIKPVVVIKLVLFDESGEKVEEFKSKVKSDEKVVLSKQAMAGWFRINEHKGAELDDEHNLNILDEVVYEAIDDLIKQIQRSNL
ncbi:MAG: hypothetical protein AAF696_18705 [Bacteroidota bacterium]